MAATAEQLGHRGFDKRYFEMHRRQHLAPAIGATALSAEQLGGIEQRRRDELIDGIAEAIPGAVNNLRTYEMIDGKLVAQDGQEMEQLLLNGLHSAVAETAKDPFYAEFRPQRARHELDETRIWQSMPASGFNTLQVFSPYTEELCSEDSIDKLQQAGQEPKTKRAMLRVAHWDGQRLNVLTRSIDNSSLDILKQAVLQVDGYQYSAANTTDMLGERRMFNLDKVQAFVYADKLVNAADEIITSRLGGERKQGRLLDEAHDTQKYVESQQQIINELMMISKRLTAQHSTYETYEQAWHQALHKHTALIKQRMLSGSHETIADMGRAADSAGVIAAARGEIYNMCGLVISANGKSDAAMATGFESLKSLMGKKVQCPECKNKVVIPKEKLDGGRLCCSDCKYEVDVCTGKVYSKPKLKQHGVQSGGVYESAARIFAEDMSRIDLNIELRRKNQQQEEIKKAA